MDTYAELVGKVVSVDRKRKGYFKVYTVSLKQTFTCGCSFFCPIQEGDIIHAMCKMVVISNHLKDIVDTDMFKHVELILVKPPLLQFPNDRDSVIQCFVRSAPRKIHKLSAIKLYDHLCTELSKKNKSESIEDVICNYMNKISTLWNKHGDERLIQLYDNVIQGTCMRKILEWWYKNRVLRRLYAFGLTNKDINEISLSTDKIYNQCIKNPYVLVALSMEKCDRIFEQLGKTIGTLDRECALIIRKIYEFMNAKSWVSVPFKILNSLFPNLTQVLDHLSEEYGVVHDMSCLYLSYPYTVETYVCSYIQNLVIKPRELFNTRYRLNTLTQDQMDAIHMALTYPVSIIVGSAGTGKTTIIKEIIYNLETQQVPYLVVSFTGKAVSRIREVISRKSPATIHRTLTASAGVQKFDHLIIDEASMVTTSLFYEFIAKFTHPYKITFIGDPHQLEPIGWGSLFSHLIDSKQIKTTKLNFIHRTDNVGILDNTNRIIQQDDSNSIPFNFNPNEYFQVCNGNIQTVYDLILSLRDLGINSTEVTVVTPYNRDVETLNCLIQKIYNEDNKKVIDYNGKIWMLKDRVSLKVNRYDINVMNGEEGIITDIGEDFVTVTFKDGANHKFNLSADTQTIDMDDLSTNDDVSTQTLTVSLLRHSFALTVHLSQGSEWNYIILYVPESLSNTRFLNKKLIYTALTRARKVVWCIGHIPSLNLAATRNSAYRCDYLQKRLCPNDTICIDNDGLKADFNIETI